MFDHNKLSIIKIPYHILPYQCFIDGVCILTIILCPLKHRFTVMQ